MNQKNICEKDFKSIPYYNNILLDGKLQDVLIMHKISNTEMIILKICYLDNIDRNRLIAIFNKCEHTNIELWKILQYNTLSNGMNALEYFHQLITVIKTTKKNNTKFKSIKEKYDFVMGGIK